MINSNCVGCGTCCIICPDLFRMKDGKVSQIDDAKTEKEEMQLELAKQSCPLACIE